MSMSIFRITQLGRDGRSSPDWNAVKKLFLKPVDDREEGNIMVYADGVFVGYVENPVKIRSIAVGASVEYELVDSDGDLWAAK